MKTDGLFYFYFRLVTSPTIKSNQLILNFTLCEQTLILMPSTPSSEGYRSVRV